MFHPTLSASSNFSPVNLQPEDGGSMFLVWVPSKTSLRLHSLSKSPLQLLDCTFNKELEPKLPYHPLNGVQDRQYPATRLHGVKRRPHSKLSIPTPEASHLLWDVTLSSLFQRNLLPPSSGQKEWIQRDGRPGCPRRLHTQTANLTEQYCTDPASEH
jgi:hypothetical protein